MVTKIMVANLLGFTAMSELLQGFDPNQRFVLVLVVFGCALTLVISLAGITAGVLNAVHRRRIEEGLKRDMLDRGMSAEEIVKVVEAASPPEDAASRFVASWCKRK